MSVWLGALASWLSWTAIPTTLLPLVPSRVRVELKEPIRPGDLGDDLDRAYTRVIGEMRRALKG